MAMVVVAGGTGLLGTALVDAQLTDGHQVSVLSRRPRRVGDVLWSPDGGSRAWTGTLGDADVVVNLAGASIGSRRWSVARKTEIRDSRLTPTRLLVEAMAEARHPPGVFLSASAVGVYGSRGGGPLTEASPPGTDFLASVCREWEAAASEAMATSRVVLLRSGVVLAREGGALAQLALPFRFYAGGPVGTGEQFMSWIHVQDWVEMVRWALATPDVSGPLNVTAPFPVTNRELAQTLGRVLGRPSALRAPAFAVRLALGEMADALVLGGQRVIPERASQGGFVFRYPTLEPALQEALAPA
jgi:uncharacterized protein (TIGR01777 family)